MPNENLKNLQKKFLLRPTCNGVAQPVENLSKEISQQVTGGGDDTAFRMNSSCIKTINGVCANGTCGGSSNNSCSNNSCSHDAPTESTTNNF